MQAKARGAWKFLAPRAFAFPFCRTHGRGRRGKTRQSSSFSENLDKCKKLDLSSPDF
jgi:hypothetical protein